MSWFSERDRSNRARARRRERRVLDDLRRRAAAGEPTPTNGELGAVVQAPKSSVAKILGRLERNGEIVIRRGGPDGVRGRAIEFCADGAALGFRRETPPVADNAGPAWADRLAEARRKDDAVLAIIETAAIAGLPAPTSATIARAIGFENTASADMVVHRLRAGGRLATEHVGRQRIFVLPDGKRTAVPGARGGGNPPAEPGTVHRAIRDCRPGDKAAIGACQWIEGQWERGSAASIEAAKCRAETVPGQSWCAAHAARVFERRIADAE